MTPEVGVFFGALTIAWLLVAAATMHAVANSRDRVAELIGVGTVAFLIVQNAGTIGLWAGAAACALTLGYAATFGFRAPQAPRDQD